MTSKWRGRWEQLGAFVRAIIGAPSYELYLEHMAAAHPNMKPLDRENFVCSRLHARYSRLGSRCC